MSSPHTSDSLRAWLRLSLEPGLEPSGLMALLAALGLPDRIYRQPAASLARHVPEPVARQMARPPAAELERALDAALRWADAPGHRILTLSDPDYPRLLLPIGGPPPLLYVRGDPRALSRPAIAVVGARNATAGGMANARAFARHLAAEGWCVASGLARGIDAAAHLGALDADEELAGSAGGTVAVLGTGIDCIYPSAHRGLAERIAERGAIISELPLGSPPLPHHFPRRNRLVAGLSHGVLVVEAARQSGSLSTARLAAESGREVFAIPGSIHSPLSRGCHALIRQGAKLVETAQDIADELGPPQRSHARYMAALGPGGDMSAATSPERDADADATAGHDAGSDACSDAGSDAGTTPGTKSRAPAASSAGSPPDNAPTARAASSADSLAGAASAARASIAPRPADPLLDALGYDPVLRDALQRRIGWDDAALQSRLLELELDGLVERLPGERYQRIR